MPKRDADQHHALNPPPIAAVSTDIAAFVGVTTRADDAGRTLLHVPTPIASMRDYERYFGGSSPATTYDGLLDALTLFFANGGRRALVVSVGTDTRPITAETLIGGLEPLTHQSCALVVVPDASRLPPAECLRVHAAVLAHCGETTGNRFAILDVPNGDQPLSPSSPVAAFHSGMAGLSSRAFGAAYYPWLRVTLPHRPGASRTVPPSGAIAGVFAQTDTMRGVWKAPANVALNGVEAPAVMLREADHDAMLSVTGVAVNAIRAFPGRGVLVWGARTLDGNSLDWRYVSVRRTALMLEASIGATLQAFAAEPNALATWRLVRSTVENFLTSQWRAGALVGLKPQEAFAVQIGLGETMTAEDLAEGRMKLSTMLAFSRPAEFVVLTFEQQMLSR